MTALELAVGLAIALVLIVGGFLAYVTFNAVVSLRQQVSKAWANIEVALQQRHDELSSLVEAVRDVMAFERDTLATVTAARDAFSPDDPVPVQATTDATTRSAIRQLLAVVERYPTLRSQSNVLDLQREIERLEGVIADRREVYNDSVFLLNTRIRSFPTNILAWVLDWRPSPFFGPPASSRG